MNSNNIVQKLWNYCNVLRDDGMSYGDYVEQLTYLLFFEMAEPDFQQVAEHIPDVNHDSPLHPETRRKTRRRIA